MKAELFDSAEFKFLAEYHDAGEFSFELQIDFKRLRIFKEGRELLFEDRPLENRMVESRSGLNIVGQFVANSPPEL